MSGHASAVLDQLKLAEKEGTLPEEMEDDLERLEDEAEEGGE